MRLEWKRVRLGEIIARFDAGVSVNGIDRPAKPGEHGVLKVSAVTEGRFKPDENKAVLPTHLPRVGIAPRQGDILISRANTIELVGASALVGRDYPMLHLSDKLWRVVLADEERDDRTWLSYLLASNVVRRELRTRATGSSGSMKNVAQKAFLMINVPRPTAKQQRWLGATFRCFDCVIGHLTRLIAAKRELKRGLMQDLLTGRRRFPEFSSSGKWQTLPLKALIQPISRPVAWDDAATYRLISIRRRNGGMFLREEKKGSEIKTKQLFTLRTGDFVLSRMQVVHGALATVPPELDGSHVSGMYMVARSAEPQRLSMAFLNYLSHMPVMYRKILLSCYGVHIEKMTFNPAAFLKKKVTIPPTLAEQNRIVEVLDAADREIALLESQREQFELQKRALMQKLLSGEVEIPGEAPRPVDQDREAASAR